jgi:hypothetical protein
MGWNTIKDHDHNLHREEKRPSDLGGYVLKRKCGDPGCDYWISEWVSVEQSGLESFC